MLDAGQEKPPNRTRFMSVVLCDNPGFSIRGRNFEYSCANMPSRSAMGQLDSTRHCAQDLGPWIGYKRYYEPLRLHKAPGHSLAGVRLIFLTTSWGLPCCVRFLCTWPAHSRCHQVVTRLASTISLPPSLLRLLPAGAFAGWGLHPLGKRRLFRAHAKPGH
jgi:hypothetical protein